MSPKVGQPPNHFVVLIPGYMGSLLRSKSSGEIVWIDVPRLLSNPSRMYKSIVEMFDRMHYPNDDLEPAGIVRDVLFLPPLFKQEQYGRMLDALQRFGYDIDPEISDPNRLSAYTFSYDWRQDNRISARQLGEKIKEWRERHDGAKAWLIGHSNGGIVSRWYIEKEGGKDHVGRLFLMGSPWDGAPKSVQVMQRGLDMMFLRFFNRFGIAEKTRDLVRTFPSYYQLIPWQYPFLRDAESRTVDPFADARWLETDEQRRMLQDAQHFNQDLGLTLSVDSLCFFGVKLPTTTGGVVSLDASGRWSEVDWDKTEAGDGTVPEHSAVHPNAREKLPYSVGHGDIYINPAVLEKLEWELVRKWRGGVLAKAVTTRYVVQFEPDKDVFDPQETIRMWATVHQVKSNLPVTKAEIDVQMVWSQAVLPGQTEPQTGLPFVQLAPVKRNAGRYEGSLQAPEDFGYYRLRATVRLPDEPPLILEELVLVEPPEDLLMPQPKAAAGGDSGGAGDGGSPLDLPLEALPGDTSGSGRQPLPPPPPPLPGDNLIRESQPLPLTGGGFEELSFATGSTTDDQSASKPGRYMNVEVDGQFGPLELGQEYTLVFDVNPEQTSVGLAALLDERQLFRPGESLIELAVHLSSKDFILYTQEPQRLRIPVEGRSRNKARFDIEPRHVGKGEITALFFKNNNFVQGMNLVLQTGPGAEKALVEVKPMGRALDATFALQPRDVSLFLQESGSGYQCTMVGAVAAQAVLPLKSQALLNRITGVRQALEEIVFLEHEGALVYQEGLDIPETTNQEALDKLARAGWLLFNELFGPRSGADAQLMGKKLRELARKSMLKLQVVSKEFLLPWGALYVAERFEPGKVNPDYLLGLRHIIENIPFQAEMPVLDVSIESQPQLIVSLNFNEAIDDDLGVSVIADQRAYWQRVMQDSNVQVVERTTSNALIDALNDPALPDQILYYYGHAEAKVDSPGESLLDFGNSQATKDDLETLAPALQPLPGQPLVFLNACQSNQLSPLYYDGFMPYFVSKGARGMIGSESRVPVVFAEKWAERFFDEFLSGETTLGEVFLSLRQEFYQQHHNLLGLLYSVYCDGDTVVVPGVKS